MRIPPPPSRRRLLPVLFLLGVGAAVAPLGAQTLFWDGNGSGIVGGGSGTWSTSNPRWSTDPEGSTYAGWTQTRDALFAGAAGTATISGAVTVGDITFSTTGYIINDNGVVGSSLAFGSTSKIGTGLHDATINAVLSGSHGFTKNGSGTLTLTGTNTYTGTTTLNTGILSISANANLGGSAATVTFTGGTLYLTASFDSARDVAIGTGGATFNTVGTGVASNWSGIISGNGVADGLTKNGSGTLTLTGANTYVGPTTINTGTLAIDTERSLGNNPETFNSAHLLLDGATLRALGNVTLNDSNRGITLGAGGAKFEVDPTFTLTIDNIIADPATGTPGTLTTTGTGTLVLGAANTYAGATHVDSGVLSIRHATALGTAAAGTTVAAGAALELEGGITIAAEALTLHGTGVSNTGALRNISGANVFGGPITLGSDTEIQTGSAGTLALTGGISGSHHLTFDGAGNTAVSSAIATGSGSVTKNGGGTLTLSGNNTYSGGTFVTAGRLIATTRASALGTGLLSLEGGDLTLSADGALNFGRATTVSANTNITLDRASAGDGVTHTLGTLSLDNHTLTLATGANITGGTAGLTVGATTLTGTAIFQADAGTALTLASLTGSNRHATFTGDGNITISGATTTGSGNVTRTGNGTLTFNGVNTQSGTTTLTSGTITVSANAALSGSTAPLVVNGGTLNLNNPAQTVASLSGTGGTINLGANHTLTVNPSSGDTTFSGELAGAGALVKSGSGAFALTGTGGNFTGNLTVSGGTLQAANSFVAPGTDLTLSGGNLTLLGNTGVASTRQVTISAATTLSRDRLGLGGAVSDTFGFLSLAGVTVTFGQGANTTDGTSGFTFGATTLTGDATFAVGTGTLLTLASLSAANRSVTFTGSGQSVVTGAATLGSGGIVKSGDSTLTFQGNNQQTGATTLSGGTITVSAGGALSGATAPLIVNGGTLTLNNTAQTIGSLSGTGGTLNLATNHTLTLNPASTTTTTFNGALTGEGALTVTGSGATTLGGANTQTGNTTLSSGTLTVSATGSLSGSTAPLVVNGGILNFNNSAQTIASLEGGGGTINLGSGLVLTVGPATYDTVFYGTLAGSGSLVKSGTGRLNLMSASSYTGTTTLVDGSIRATHFEALGTGSLALQGGTLQLHADTAFSSSRPVTLTGNAAVELGRYNPGSGLSHLFGTLSLGAHQLTLAAGASVNSTSTLAFGGATTLTGSGATFNVGTGTSLTLAAINGSNASFTVTGAGATRIAGDIATGSGTLTKSGTGTLTLSGANSYTGTTTISAGILQFSQPAALYNSDTAQWTAGKLAVSSGATAAFNVGGAGEFTSSQLATLTTPAALSGFASGALFGVDTTNAPGGSFTFNGAIADPNGGANSFGLAKQGSGTLVLTGTQTYSGTTRVTGGTLQLGNSGTVLPDIGIVDLPGGTLALGAANETAGALSGSGTIELFNGTGRTLTVMQNSATTFSGTLQGSGGALVKDGLGTLTLSGVNTHTGGTTLKAGTLALASTAALSTSGPITFTGGTLQFNASNPLDYSSRIVDSTAAISLTASTSAVNVVFASPLPSTNTGGLVKNGPFTLTLSAANQHTGGTHLNAGTLALAHPAALGSSTFTIAGGTLGNTSGAALTLTTNNAQSWSNSVSFTGPHNLHLGTGAVTLTGNTTANVTNSTLTVGGSIGETGGARRLTVSGAGTLALAGANTFTGGILLYGGTLALGHAGAAGSGELEFDSGKIDNSSGGPLTLSTNNALELTGSFTFLGTHSLNLGTGNVTLTADSTITVAANTLTLGGPIADQFSFYDLNKTGAGTLVLSGTSDSTVGFTVSAGTLQFAKRVALNGGSFTGQNLSVSSGATAAFNVGGAGEFTVADIIAIKNLSISINPRFADGSYLGLDTSNAGTGGFNFNSTLSNPEYSSRDLGLVKLGSGTLTLSAANTYSGPTIVAAGTLQFTQPSSLYNASTPYWTATNLTVRSGATAAFNVGGSTGFSNSNLNILKSLVSSTGGFQSGSFLGLDTTNATDGAFTYGSNIANPNSGSNILGLVKLGTGTLTLSGNSTYTGGTTVPAGTLRATTSAGALGLGAVALTGGTLELANDTGLAFNRPTTVGVSTTITSDRLTAGEGVTHTLGTLGLGAVTLSVAPGTLVTSGTAGLSFGATTLTGNATFSPAAGARLTLASVTGNNIDTTFTGAGDSAITGALAPGTGALLLTGTGTLTLSGNSTYTGATTVSGGTLILQHGSALGSATTGTTIATGATLALQGDITVAAEPLSLAGTGAGASGALRNLSGANTYHGPLTLTAATEIQSDAGTLTLGTGGLTGAFGLTFDGAGDTTVSGLIATGAGTLTKTGTGTLTLSAANTFTGATSVTGGVLLLAHSLALQNSPLNLPSGGTGTLSFGSLTAATLPGLTGTGTLALTNASAAPVTLSVGHNHATSTFQGTLSGTGNLTKIGTGTLLLTGSAPSTYTGITRVDAGILRLDFGSLATPTNLLPNSSSVVLGGGTLSVLGKFNAATSQTFASTTLAAGASTVGVTSNGAATTLALGTVTRPLGTTLNLTTPALGSITTTSPATLGLLGGWTTLNGIDFAGLASGLLAAPTYSANTLAAGVHTNVTSSLAPSANATTSSLRFNTAGAQTLTLSGVNTITSGGLLVTANVGPNATTLTGGTLRGAAGADLVVFNYNTSSALTIASIIADNTTATGLTKSGNGTLILSGANTFTGTTTINAGTLRLAHAAALPTTAVVTLADAAGATLDLNNVARTLGSLAGGGPLGGAVTLGSATLTTGTTSDTTFAGTISGTGGLTKQGSGTFTLASAQTYTGPTTVNAGTLKLDFTTLTTPTNLLSASSTLAFGGGQLEVHGKSAGTTTQTFAGTTLTSGASTLTLVPNAGTATTVALGAIARTTGATVDFASPATTTLSTTPALTTTLLGGWATLNRRDWLAATTGTLAAATYTSDTWSAGNNTDLTASAIVPADATTHSLRFATPSAQTLTLSGTNTLTSGGLLVTADVGASPTLITGGTLRGASGADLVIFNYNLASALTLASTLANHDTATGLTKSGGGTLILSGANTYTGPTAVNAGTVRTAHASALSSSSLVTLANTPDAVLDLNSLSQTIAALAGGGTSGGAVTLGSATLTTGTAATTIFAGVVSGTGGLVKQGTGTFTLSGANTYSGTTVVNVGVLDVRHATALGTTAAGTTVANDAALQLQGDITIGAEPLTLRGTGVSNTGALRNLSGANSFAGPLTLAGATEIQSDAGTLTLGAGGITGAFALTFDGSGATTVSGAIGADVVSLTKTGAGTLTLGGNNTFTGPTTITTGTVSTAHASALSSSSLVTLANTSGAILDLAGLGQTIGALAGGGTSGGNITLGAAILTTGTAASTSFAGVISGTGGLAKQGTGTLTLSGASTYSGTTVVNAGVLDVRHATALGTTAAGTTVASGAALQLQGGITIAAEPLELAGIGISDTGALRNISGVNSFAGPITLSGATKIQSDAGTLTLGAGGINGAFALTFDGAGASAVSGVIGANITAVTKSGAGLLTFSGNNTFAGGLTLNGGTLAVSTNDHLGAAAGPLAFAAGTLRATGNFTATRATTLGTGGGTFDVVTSSTLTWNGDITGASGNTLTKIGTGTLLLGGANTYSGDTIISFGTLKLGAATALSPNTKLNVASGATFDANGFAPTFAELTGAGSINVGAAGLAVALAGSSSFSGTLGGSGGFTMSGNGTLTLAGANTYTGTTTIGNGTVNLGAAGALPANSPLSLSAGGVLDLNGFAASLSSLTGSIGTTLALTGANLAVAQSTSTTFAGILSGNGGLTKSGSGILTLTGANTFSGATALTGGQIKLNGSAANSAFTVSGTGTLSGSGTVGALTISSGGTLAPGNSPGTTNAGPTTWSGGGNYVWEINDGTGTRGTHYDLLSITGALTISATSASRFTLSLTSLQADNSPGNVINFNTAINHTYTVATASSGITGFSSSAFTLDTTGFTNAANGGSWSLGTSGNDLNLTFTASAIPEPSTYAALLGAAALALATFRRRRTRLAK